MIRTIALSGAVLVAAGLCMAGPATAQTADSVTVSTTDLNLSSNSGRAMLNARIGHAVEHICGSLHTRSTSELQNRLECSRQALVQAQPQADRMIAAANSRHQMAGPITR